MVHIVFPTPMLRWSARKSDARPPSGPFPQRSLSILVLAALSRRNGWRVKVVDEAREPLPREQPDLAFITAWTFNAPSAYELAGWYRSRGVPVVLGGVHPSMLPSEASRFADSVVVGEAESVLSDVLEDAIRSSLKPLYRGQWTGMDHVPGVAEYLDLYTAGTSLRTAPIHSIQTSRGCKFNCSFCSVIRLNGRGARHMPPERVVEELRILNSIRPRIPGGTPVYFVDDDVMSDRDHTAEMLDAIVTAGVTAPLAFQASIGISRDQELLTLASKAGCVSLFIGLESVSRASLLEANKKNRPHEYAELIGRVHRHGIGVSAGIIFGFDHDGPDIFDQTVDMLEEAEVDSARFGILTPMPGTHVFSQLYREERITSFDWRLYDGMHTVIEPASMSARQLQDGVAHAYRRWSSNRPRMRRFMRQSRTLSLRLAAASLVSSRRYALGEEALRSSHDGQPFHPHPDDLVSLVDSSEAPAPSAMSVAASSAERLIAGQG